MGEMSPEATVAAEAAGMAVEELHSREEQAAEASLAAVEAGQAMGIAADAQMAAAGATEAATVAYDSVALVAEEVQETQAVATEAVIVAEAAVDYAEQNHREITELKDMFAQFLERTAPQESPESRVQEVAVDDRPSPESQPEPSEEAAQASSAEPQSGSGRRRLARRVRRNTRTD